MLRECSLGDGLEVVSHCDFVSCEFEGLLVLN
jgi:hypothetical protein